MKLKIIQILVKLLLDNADKFNWSLQGFGMLRLYLPMGARLNIWSHKHQVENVSLIHTHPWHFSSLIVFGKLRNIRYRRAIYPSPCAKTYEFAAIKPGTEGRLMHNLGLTDLVERPIESYFEGSRYSQTKDEIHASMPEDLCVTINIRERIGADEALVFWLKGTDWVDAKPRIATQKEVEEITKAVLERHK